LRITGTPIDVARVLRQVAGRRRRQLAFGDDVESFRRKFQTRRLRRSAHARPQLLLGFVRSRLFEPREARLRHFGEKS
jgi:hypothetical protein